jgi:hypothetical protein
MSGAKRREALDLIKRNIELHGSHVYIVVGKSLPRFAYTIGLKQSWGAELVLAGAIYYNADAVTRIMNTIGQRLGAQKASDATFVVDDLGSFRLRKAHASWTRSLLLGALDYYKVSEIEAYQIVPDDEHWTIDIPNLEKEWSAKAEPVWKWLHEGWDYAIPPESTATTNLDALRGVRITEVMRWEDGWEMFAGPGPDVSFEDARVVPLASLLASDPSLKPAVDLEVGKGMWREGDETGWHPWASRAN